METPKNDTPMELWIFHGGPTPRRAVIYIRERAFPDHLITVIPTTKKPGGPAEAPGKPPGSVPMLRLPTGQIIRESVSIMEYLEDVADQRGMKSLRGGERAEDRAKVRDMMGMIDSLTLTVEIAAVNGSILFASQLEGKQSPEAVRWLLAYVRKLVASIANYSTGEDTPWLVGRDVTYADCALFATMQYASEMLGLDLTEGHDKLKAFWNSFKQRESAKVPEGTWPPALTEISRKWIDY